MKIDNINYANIKSRSRLNYKLCWGVGYFISGVFFAIIAFLLLYAGTTLQKILVPVYAGLTVAISFVYFSKRTALFRVLLILLLALPITAAAILQIGLWNGWFILGWREV